MLKTIERPYSFIQSINNKNALFLVIGISILIHLFCMVSANLLVEETYYWNYSQHLDFSYLDHPPMVAVLIKLTTTFLGTNEFAVRAGGLLCWVIMAYVSYGLSELIHKGSGLFSVLLVAILPFFFLQSFFMTPDMPLLACWSALLYCLYRTLVMGDTIFWYASGLCLGLGMLSKYTIVLLALATLFYMIIAPQCRGQFLKKEPYVAALIALLLFTPVIYWNATHEWVSFLFQSSRRFEATSAINTHNVLGLVLLFITPLGLLGLWDLVKSKRGSDIDISHSSKLFLQVYTLVPLGFFIVFSVNHEVNFNWIGPLFLAFIPWVAATASHNTKLYLGWLATSVILLCTYTVVLLVIIYNPSQYFQQKALLKIIAWEKLVIQFNQLAHDIEATTHHAPAFVPLDNYPIASELSFYQAKLFANGKIDKIYPIIGANVFGLESLMYRYWTKDAKTEGIPLILIGKELWRFDQSELANKFNVQEPLAELWSVGEGQSIKNIPYYYKVVQMSS